MPSFDVSRLIQEDEAVKGMDVPYRFGKRFEVNYSLKDGKWADVESGKVWLLKVRSKGAYSINFIMSRLYLPKGAELYIYNTEGSMIYGPVTERQNLVKGIFLTEIIKGESVILYLYIPEYCRQEPDLEISGIVHGYRDLYAGIFEKGKSLGASGSCEKDVACYPAWSNESDAVALVLLASGTEHCSGALVNNTAQNFRSYFLTAFHCIDLNKDGNISTTEEYDAENWAFRFRYKKTSCGGGTVAKFFTLNRDNYRAGWNTSDFALVELLDSPLGDTRVSFLGWDRSGSTPTKGSCIHHPSGDVMKISFDNNQLVETSYLSNSGSNYWKVDWDIGVTEGGSSGSPLFDQSKRVIGQLYGGYSACGGNDLRDWFGCYYRSWSGDGTDDTRLSNWLDPCGTNPPTVNTVRLEITGPSKVCTSNVTFSLNNLPPNSTVSWTATKVTPSQGNTANATFHSSCSNIGNGKVTFNVSTTNCGDTVAFSVSKTYIAGGPDASDVSLRVTDNLTGQTVDPMQMCTNSTYILYCENSSSCGTSNYSWTLPYGMSLISQSQNWALINTNSSSGGIMMVHGSTCCAGCGSNVLILTDVLSTGGWNCGGGWYMSFTPNPTSDETVVELKTGGEKSYEEDDAWDLVIYDRQLAVMKSAGDVKGSKYVISTAGWREGLYIVKVKVKDKTLYGKFIVER